MGGGEGPGTPDKEAICDMRIHCTYLHYLYTCVGKQRE